MGLWRQIVRFPPFQPQPLRRRVGSSSTLTAGVASFVSSGPTAITVSATDATGGLAPYTYQWQRNTNGGSYSNISNGGGVTGATTLTLIDGSAVAGNLYGYKLVYTDSALSTDTSNVVTAQIYTGGSLGGGSSVFPVIGSLIVFGVKN